MKRKDPTIPRRQALQNAAVLGLGGMMTPLSRLDPAGSQQAANRTVLENTRQGTKEWQLQYTTFDDPITLASYPLIRRLRSSRIEGFASRTSLYPGESIDFKVSLNPAGRFFIDIYRMGYYDGAGGRHFTRLGPLDGTAQAVSMMTIERLRECNWDTAASLVIPADWPGGVYLARLSRDEVFGTQSYIIFVVKEHRKTDLLVQVSDLTWQAYNKWPGNDSLYDDGTPEVWYTGPNVRVSFDRPYSKYCQIIDAPLSAGSGEYLLWEHPMTFWLEQQGYDVSYCSNLDLHLDPDILQRSKVFLSVGHDEYWSREMFESARAAFHGGLSIAFFSGNSIHREINLFDSSITGDRCRSFSRHRSFEDEQDLLGNTSYGPGYGDWVVKNHTHWIYEGTGLREGDRIPAIIGWEYHGPPSPDIPGLIEVARSRARQLGEDESADGQPENFHSAVIYPGPKGNWVFNAGTIWWPEGLAQPPGHIPAGHNPEMRTFGINSQIQKISANVLNRMIKDSRR